MCSSAPRVAAPSIHPGAAHQEPDRLGLDCSPVGVPGTPRCRGSAEAVVLSRPRCRSSATARQVSLVRCWISGRPGRQARVPALKHGVGRLSLSHSHDVASAVR